jgi:hypothetical protein
MEVFNQHNPNIRIVFCKNGNMDSCRSIGNNPDDMALLARKYLPA